MGFSGAEMDVGDRRRMLDEQWVSKGVEVPRVRRYARSLTGLSGKGRERKEVHVV